MATINQLLGTHYSLKEIAGKQYPLMLTIIATRIFAELGDKIVNDNLRLFASPEHNDSRPYICSICYKKAQLDAIRLLIAGTKINMHKNCIPFTLQRFYNLCYQTYTKYPSLPYN